MSVRTVLGVSCDFHDAAAALLVDGEIVAAVEEERVSRVKHDARVPSGAMASVLAIAGVDGDAVDAVVFYEKPLRVISRNLASRQARGPGALGSFVREFPTLLRRNLMVGYRIDTELRRLGATRTVPLHYSEHHLSHAAAAFLPSPFASAAIVTVDGVGEWSTATIGLGVNHRVEQLEEQRFPDSYGLLYSLVTAWCGFAPNDGEYKLMGLAPFGEPCFREQLDRIAALHDDGSLTIDRRAVGWWSRPPEKLRGLIGSLGAPRRPGEPLEQRHADLARSVQELLEDGMARMARRARDLTGSTKLCLAGGVALNAVANGHLLREANIDDLWVQPAAGDAGSALGAALWLWHTALGNPRTGLDDETVQSAGRSWAIGPRFRSDEVTAWLDEAGIAHRRIADDDHRAADVAGRLADGAVVGWFEGRMEFGPRALGHRSILADPRSPTVHRRLNVQVKGRESYRPFAPAVLWEEAREWFVLDRPLPTMTVVVDVAPARRVEPSSDTGTFEERASVVRSEIPACTHVDGTARVQTVHRELSPAFHRLLSAFRDRTGCPVLLNTSFNVAGEPIVCTPDQAVACAVAADLDVLVLEDVIIERDALRVLAPQSSAGTSATAQGDA